MYSRIRAGRIVLRAALLALLLGLGAQAALAVTVTRTPTSTANCSSSSAGGSGDAMKRVVKNGVISSTDALVYRRETH